MELQIEFSSDAFELHQPSSDSNFRIIDAQQKMGLDGTGLVDISMVIELTASVPLGIVASWLYDKYFKKKKKGETLIINKRKVIKKSKNDLVVVIEKELKVIK
ncbi:MAG: hypothetical protein AAGA02_00190 [Bacteroidota bacterium]